MKKLILIAGVALIAQTASAQLSIAPEVGFLMTGATQKIDGDKADFLKMKPGFRVGANLDMGITQHFHVQAGVFYALKGAKTDAIDGGIITIPETKQNINYLEIPVYLNYMTGEDGGNRFFVGAGPYLGYAFSAKAKVGDDKEDIEIGNDEKEATLKPMDFGVNVNAGYMLSMGLYVRAHYSMGLANIQPGGDSDNSAKNYGFGVSLGYAFKF